MSVKAPMMWPMNEKSRAFFIGLLLRVLPPPDEPLSRRLGEWRESLESYLKRSSLVVEVLGTLPGQRIAGTDQRVVLSQHQLSLNSNKTSWLGASLHRRL